MTDAVIDKLNKSGHRIYLLTGRRDKRFSYKRVFERYDFPYEDESVKDVFESVSPDMVVFMGAFDTNFDWRRARQESTRYASALMNIMSAYSVVGKGRFVYFSSHEVYSRSYQDNIPESESVSPSGFKALALAQGEEICDNYRRMQGLDTVILRFDHLYGIPVKGQEESNPCFRLCLEGLKTGKISASDRNVFSMIYLNDAVELAYRVMEKEKTARSCYHISSGEEISEMKLADLVAKGLGAGVQVVNNSVGEKRRVILDTGSYEQEYTQQIFTHCETGVENVVHYINRYKDSFIHAEDKGGGTMGRIWHTLKGVLGSLFPFAENMICFIPFFILNNSTAGSEYFARLDFYLLYVLLFAIVHGQRQAVFSSLLAIAGYCYREMGGNSGFEILLDHNTYVWMAQLFIVGMAVGYMRDQLYQLKKDDEEEIRYLQRRVEDISDINDSNVRMKQGFESQLVSQRDSLGKIYDITSSLELYAPEEVLFYAARVLGELMDSRDVAVYTVANADYARLFSFTSREARKLGNSIKYTAMEKMYAELKERHVFINKDMDDKLPLMAGAVYTEDKMELILMIWGIPWQRMTLGEANRLTIVGSLIQNAVVRSNRYLEVLTSQRYLEGTNVLARDAFAVLVKAFFEARSDGLTECTLLEIHTQTVGIKQAVKILGSGIRQTDYMGISKDGRLYVLLSNTDEENARGVMERFRKSGLESSPREGAQI